MNLMHLSIQLKQILTPTTTKYSLILWFLRCQFGRLAAAKLLKRLTAGLYDRLHTNSNSTRLLLLLFVVSLNGLADLFNTLTKPFSHRFLHSLIKGFKKLIDCG